MASPGEGAKAEIEGGELTSRRRSVFYYLFGYLFGAATLAVIGWVLVTVL